MRLATTLLLLVSFGASGGTFVVEDSSLVPVPTLVAEAIAKSEESARTERHSVNCKFVGKRVALGGKLQDPCDWIVTTADACMWAASAAPVWIVVNTSGSHQVVLSHRTYSVRTGRHKRHGLLDLSTSRGTAARDEQENWVFSGSHYRLASRKVIERN